jgi:hypothetical protein
MVNWRGIMSLSVKKSNRKEMILETDLLLSPRDFMALKNPTAHDAQDLESYLDFLEEIGVFDPKKVRAKLYREVFAL